jgi:uncharacterized protein (DUF2336 family)
VRHPRKANNYPVFVQLAQCRAELAKVDAVIALQNARIAHHDIDPARANESITIAKTIDTALRAF